MDPRASSRPLPPTKELVERFESMELRLEQLERTLSVVAREAIDASVAGPCPDCERSLLLVDGQSLKCWSCGFERSM